MIPGPEGRTLSNSILRLPNSDRRGVGFLLPQFCRRRGPGGADRVPPLRPYQTPIFFTSADRLPKWRLGATRIPRVARSTITFKDWAETRLGGFHYIECFTRQARRNGRNGAACPAGGDHDGQSGPRRPSRGGARVRRDKRVKGTQTPHSWSKHSAYGC